MNKKTQGFGSSLVTYYVADIYISNVECFKSYFAEDTYGIDYRESVLSIDNDTNALTSFNTSHRLESENPRTGIWYYEPGHYCMVVIDGRDEGYSKGVTLREMSSIFEELGCESAYNLAGGKLSVMTFDDAIVNQPVDGGRTVSDCLTIEEVDR